VVFDLDDTLYPHRRFMLSGYRAVARHVEGRGLAEAWTVFRFLTACVRRGTSRHAFDRCCEAHGWSPGLVGEWLEVFRGHAPSLRLPRGSAEVLARARRHAAVGVLTNGLPDVQRRKVAALGLEPLVDVVVYADEHHDGGKPNPAVFHAIWRALGRPRRMCMVGNDPERDIRPALALGWRAICVGSSPAEPCGEAPSRALSLARLSDLLALSENIWTEGHDARELHYWTPPDRP
jgi:putative hydrolase of the HAD superfamily